ncbi:MAG: HAD family hydrolase [Myxococcota bacterium]
MGTRAISFDLFDTLVDLSMENLPLVEVGGRKFRSTLKALHQVAARHSDIDFESFGQMLLAVDSELRPETYERGLELPTIRRFGLLVQRLEIDAPDLAEQLTQTHMAGIYGQTRFLPHHPEVLEGLRGRVVLGVCSNFSHAPTAERVLTDAGLRPHFDAVTISEGVGIRKPRPEIFEALLADLDVPPEEAVHVGDDLSSDIDGAARVGMRTAWIQRRVADPERALEKHHGARPTWIIRDLAELLEILEATC